MTQFEKAQWEMTRKNSLQAFLNEICESLSTWSSCNCKEFQVEVVMLEKSKLGRYSAYKQLLVITVGKYRLAAIELEDIGEEDANEGFIEFLSTIDGDFLPIGTVLKLNRIELAKGLEDSMLEALAICVTYLLKSTVELVVCEANEINRQPTVWLETWKSSYGIRSEKWVQYNGVQYLRSDSPSSWHF